jgi:hypothetical protein
MASDCHRISASECLSLGQQKGSPLPVSDLQGTPHSHTDEAFPPAIKTQVWQARMRNLERRRHQEDLLYHVVTYLISLDKLFDEHARFLREQTHRAEQAELAVRMHQIRVAQAEARTVAAISSEAVTHDWNTHHRMGRTFWDPASSTRRCRKVSCSRRRRSCRTAPRKWDPRGRRGRATHPTRSALLPGRRLAPRVACLRDAPRNEAVPAPSLELCPSHLLCPLYPTV